MEWKASNPIPREGGDLGLFEEQGGVGKGKSEGFWADSEGWHKKCIGLRSSCGVDYRRFRRINKRFLKLFLKFEKCELAN